MVSSPEQASGNSLEENIHDCDSLDERIQFTRVCEIALFKHRVLSERKCKTRLDEDDGFGQLIPLCREYTLSRAHPQSRIFAAIPGGTIIGPVIEVEIVKILERHGFEIAIPSPNDHVRTSYVVISREKSRFVDEVHIPNAVLRSSAELLTELQRSGGESREEQADTSIQETGAIHDSSYTSNKETGANTFSIPPTQASFYTKRTIPTNERKWKVIHVHSPDGGDLAIAVSKMVTIMVRHYDQDERQSDGSVHWDTIRPGLLKAFAKRGARDFSEKYR